MGARRIKVQSSRRELWANVSLSHPAFGSLLRQSLFLCQSSHFTCFFRFFVGFPSERKRQETWRLAGTLWLRATSKSQLVFFSPSVPFFSLPPTLSASPWAKLRGGSGWVDKQETLVTHYDKRRIILYDSRGIFSRGCVMCPSHSSIHLAAMKDRLSNLCQCVPGGGGWKKTCVGCLDPHMHINT